MRALSLFSAPSLVCTILASCLIQDLSNIPSIPGFISSHFSNPNNDHISFPGKTLRALSNHPWTKHFGWWKVYSDWSAWLTSSPRGGRQGTTTVNLTKNTWNWQGVPLRNQKKETEKCAGLPWSSIFPSFCSIILLGMMAFVLIHVTSWIQDRCHRPKRYDVFKAGRKGEGQP